MALKIIKIGRQAFKSFLIIYLLQNSIVIFMDLIKKRKHNNQSDNNHQIDINDKNNNNQLYNSFVSFKYFKSYRLAVFVSLYFTLLRLLENYRINFIPSSLFSSFLVVSVLIGWEKEELAKKLLVISTCSIIKYIFPHSNSESWLFSIFTAQIVRLFAIKPESLDHGLDRFWKSILQIDPKGFVSAQLMAQKRLSQDSLLVDKEEKEKQNQNQNQSEIENKHEQEGINETGRVENEELKNGIVPCSILHPQHTHLQAIALTMKAAAINSLPIYALLHLASFLFKLRGINKGNGKIINSQLYLHRLNHHLLSISKSTAWISILSGLVMTQLCITRRLKLIKDYSYNGLLFWIIGFLSSILSMPFCPPSKRMTLAIFSGNHALNSLSILMEMKKEREQDIKSSDNVKFKRKLGLEVLICLSVTVIMVFLFDNF